jgi:hypothetical protein
LAGVFIKCIAEKVIDKKIGKEEFCCFTEQIYAFSKNAAYRDFGS